ncbi:MAG: L-serine ammonia-lyase [Planctomycetes bacterium]|nr:L-serine ammonia-lyase [Planctomycetota bacterium]
MESLRELYRIGSGPSASHTMGPKRAAELFLARNPNAPAYRVTLFGSLAATGKGHLTDTAIQHAFAGHKLEIRWKAKEHLPLHPNGMLWEALDDSGNAAVAWQVYSVGGGALLDPDNKTEPSRLYPVKSMKEVMDWSKKNSSPIWKFVEQCEGKEIWEYLAICWKTMQEAIERGLESYGVLPGSLKLRRKAHRHYQQAKGRPGPLQRTGLLTAYALAVSEENASAGTVVTAPTCGACGVVPAVLRYLKETLNADDRQVLRAMATAGLIGNFVKHNASISGAAVGCQGEVGTACSMAAAAAAQLMGGDVKQIEYAAEMGIEHHLGLTCDPVAGLVQIPCIERNAVGAMRAVDCADYALLSDGDHEIPFDTVVRTMKATGEDMQERYRETSEGGLAKMHIPEGVDPKSIEANHCA